MKLEIYKFDLPEDFSCVVEPQQIYTLNIPERSFKGVFNLQIKRDGSIVALSLDGVFQTAFY